MGEPRSAAEVKGRYETMGHRLRELGATDDDFADFEIAWADEGDEDRPPLLGDEGRERLFRMGDAELTAEVLDWREQREAAR